MSAYIEDEFIDLTFLKKWTSYSVTSDDGVIKYQEKEYEGETPNECSKCTIKYEGRKTNGQLIDQKRDRNQIVNIRLFVDEHITGIHYAISQMKIGEKAWFKFSPKYHYFKYESKDNQIDLKNLIIDKTEHLYYYIELIGDFLILDIYQPKQKLSYNTFESIFVFYSEKKTEGNEFFKLTDFNTAYKRYERAINAYQCFPKPVKYSISNKQRAHLFFLLAQLYLNTSLCELKMDMAQESLSTLANCQKFTDLSKDSQEKKIENDEYDPTKEGGDFLMSEPVIDYSNHQQKIYFRLGEAYFQLKDFEQSFKWFKKSGDAKKIRESHEKLIEFNKGEKKLFGAVIKNLDKEKEEEIYNEKMKRSQSKLTEKKKKEDISLENLKHGRLMDFAAMENFIDDSEMDEVAIQLQKKQQEQMDELFKDQE